ncbi:MAG: DUF5106 domain-containing protein [Tannerella sp.]|jgi:hypothetical protein|nr:DUF5106 domain-containing protein [Tannerella sp.]
MNRNKKKYFTCAAWLLGLAITVSGCANKPREPARHTFPAVTVPTVYIDPATQAEYLAMHYWDLFNFTDTVYVGSAAGVTEQALANYLSILPYTSYPVICRGLTHLMEEAEKHEAMYAFISTHLERFLFDLNSPLRNEEFFIPVLEQMVASKTLNEPRKVRPGQLLSQLQKNRPSALAANIRYALASGARSSLHDLKTDFTLMLFHNLDCGNCRELANQIKNSQAVTEMQKRRRLTVLSIYPGQDVEAWKKYLPEMPSSWINGYDCDDAIYGQERYALRTVPTLYLTDKNHRVVMKDVPFNYVEYFLNNILNPPTQSNK